jgi:Ca-activated chloride channel family protein
MLLGFSAGWANPEDLREQPPSEDQKPTFRSSVTVVSVPCVVEGPQGFVDNLAVDDFQVFEEGEPRPIEYFIFEGGEESRPMNLVLLLDTSGSVKGELDFEQEAATTFLRNVLRPETDMAAVVQFDSELYLVQDFTFDLQRLEDAVWTARAGGATKLYDAVWVAVEDLLRHEVGRRVIVVLSDGDDTSSSVSSDSAIRKAQEYDVIIFGIGVRGRGFRSNFGKLKEFARETGGLFFNPRNRLDQLTEAFTVIHSALRHQYTLGYPSAPANGDSDYRQIEVKLKRKDLKGHCRQGYYPQGVSDGG